MDTKVWSELQEELRQTVGENNFSNWIAPLQLSSIEDGMALILVPNNFMGNFSFYNFFCNNN